MCIICGNDGACICRATPENAGLRFIPGVLDRVAMLRCEFSRLSDELRAVEVELERELRQRGSRVGDGSDQLRLFDADRTPGMFGV